MYRISTGGGLALRRRHGSGHRLRGADLRPVFFRPPAHANVSPRATGSKKAGWQPAGKAAPGLPGAEKYSTQYHLKPAARFLQPCKPGRNMRHHAPQWGNHVTSSRGSGPTGLDTRPGWQAADHTLELRRLPCLLRTRHCHPHRRPRRPGTPVSHQPTDLSTLIPHPGARAVSVNDAGRSRPVPPLPAHDTPQPRRRQTRIRPPSRPVR